MSDKVKNSPEKPQKSVPENEKDTLFLYLEQLRTFFQNNPEIIKQLDMIAEKLKKVSDSVLFIISWMIRSKFAGLQANNLHANNASSTAAIMAARSDNIDFIA